MYSIITCPSVVAPCHTKLNFPEKRTRKILHQFRLNFSRKYSSHFTPPPPQRHTAYNSGNGPSRKSSKTLNYARHKKHGKSCASGEIAAIYLFIICFSSAFNKHITSAATPPSHITKNTPPRVKDVKLWRGGCFIISTANSASGSANYHQILESIMVLVLQNVLFISICDTLLDL